MADYKDIAGTTVRGNAGVLTSAKTGELFYDSTNNNFSYRFPNVTSAGAWRTGGSMNTGKIQLAGAGIQTAAIAFGGYNAPADARENKTESYDGTSWTEVNDLNTARSGLEGGGTYTSGLAFGGYDSDNTAKTESWNGTSWTETADLGTARRELAGCGSSSTNGLAFGGKVPAGTAKTET